MSLLGDTIDVFEGNAKRILWLPPLTLGYTFTLSGIWFEFVIAVAAIGGARMFSDLFQRTSKAGKDETILTIVTSVKEQCSTLRILYLDLIGILYVIAAVYGGWNLYRYFDHSDPIIVTLSGVYLGVIVVISTNVDW